LLLAIKEAQAVGFSLGEIAEYLRAARRLAASSRRSSAATGSSPKRCARGPTSSSGSSTISSTSCSSSKRSHRPMRSAVRPELILVSRVRLVETADGRSFPPPPPLSDGQIFMELRLTSEGERVLRGEADRVELMGVDRWLGGTHVTTTPARRSVSRCRAPRCLAPDCRLRARPRPGELEPRRRIVLGHARS
jgi:hypothetical protein